MHAAQDDAGQRAASSATPLSFDAPESEVPATIKVAIASNRRSLQTTWLSVLARGTDIEIRGQPILDSIALAACMEHCAPDVVLLDKALLDRLDEQSLQRLIDQRQSMRVLLLWDEICPALVADVLRYRFHGLLPTTCPPEIGLKAIRAVRSGELWLSRASLAIVIADLFGLPDANEPDESADMCAAETADALTPREAQVVELLRRGCINKEIARELGIMEDTVKKHLHSVYAKLGVHRRAHVAMRHLTVCSAPHSIQHLRLQARGAIGSGN